MVFSQDTIDEDALFSDTSTVVASSTLVNDSALTLAREEKSVGFSGQITSALDATATRSWFTNDQHPSDARISPTIIGNLTLDVRLPGSIKAYCNTEAGYYPSLSADLSTKWSLRELFVDLNINRLVYFRTGKQVLQWGRCFFFNPTDLINVEKKSFIEKLGAREGAFGLKTHIPFGTRANIYSFVNMAAARADSMSIATKAEVLIGGTEMAISLWNKQGFAPVYGYDFSSQLWGTQVYGEVSLSSGRNYKTIHISSDSILSVVRSDHDLIARAAIGLSRQFTILDVKDRLSLYTEFYYNQAGYSLDIFKDHTPYTYAQPVMDPLTRKVNSSGNMAGYFLGSGLYEMNNFTNYYVAAFASLDKFILPDLTLSCNGIVSIDGASGIVTTSLSYATLNNMLLGFSVNSYIGRKNREYTYLGDAATVRISAGLTF